MLGGLPRPIPSSIPYTPGKSVPKGYDGGILVASILRHFRRKDVTDDFVNEENLLARRLWTQRLVQQVQEALEQVSSDLARGAQALELGTNDPLAGLPGSLFRGLEDTRADPEETVRFVAALWKAALGTIVEMMRAHWQESRTPLVPN